MPARILLAAFCALALLVPASAQEPGAPGQPVYFEGYGITVDLPEGGESLWPDDPDWDYPLSAEFHWWKEGEIVYGMIMLVDYSYAPVIAEEAAEYRDLLIEELIADQPEADNTVTSSVTVTASAAWQQSYLVVDDEEGGTGTTICVAPKGDLLVSIILYSLPDNYDLLQPEVQRRLDAIVFDDSTLLADEPTAEYELPRFGLTFNWPESYGFLSYADEAWGVTDFGPIEYACYWERSDLPLYLLVWLTVLRDGEPEGSDREFFENEFLAGTIDIALDESVLQAGDREWTVRWYGAEDPEYPYDETVCLWTYQDRRYHFITAEYKQGFDEAAAAQLAYMLSQVEYAEYDRPGFPAAELIELPESGFSIELPGGGTSSRPGDPLWASDDDQAQFQWIHPDQPLSMFRFAATEEMEMLEDFSEEELLEFHDAVAERLSDELGIGEHHPLGHINTTGIKWYGYQYDGSRYPWPGFHSVVYMAFFGTQWYILYFGYNEAKGEPALAAIERAMKTADITAH